MATKLDDLFFDVSIRLDEAAVKGKIDKAVKGLGSGTVKISPDIDKEAFKANLKAAINGVGDVGKINITPTVDLKDANAKIKSVSGTINVPVTPVVDTQGVLSTVRSALGSAQISLNVPLSPIVNASEFNNAVKNSVAGLSALQFPIRLGVDQTFFSESVKRAIAAAGKLKLNVDVDAKGIESLTALAKAQTEMLKEQNRGRKLALETDPNSASSIRARASLMNAQTKALTLDSVKNKNNAQAERNRARALLDSAKAQTEMLKEQNRSRKLALETDPNSALSIRARASLMNAQTKALTIDSVNNKNNAQAERNRARALLDSIKASKGLESSMQASKQHTEGFLRNMRQSIQPMRDLAIIATTYFGVHGVLNFLRSLVEVRGEFEKQKVALETLLQSREQANKLFNDIQSLAVKSPFQFKELISFTKQLAAYQVPTDELYDTNKRLADLSAGLGVEMSRLILAYGQVRSASVLRGQELRQFTEAGIPLVQALADKFSELEGRIVSTGEVFQRISTRDVPFQMVKDILWEMTDAGGAFYRMQEKQAETLAGKVSNLKDAYEIMLNQLGTQSQGVLNDTIGMLYNIINGYEGIVRAIKDLVVAYGTIRVVNWFKGMSGVDALIASNQQGINYKIDAQVISEATSQNRPEFNMYNKLMQQAKGTALLTTYQAANLAVTERLSKAQANLAYYAGKMTFDSYRKVATVMGWYSEEVMKVRRAINIYGNGMRDHNVQLNRMQTMYYNFMDTMARLRIRIGSTVIRMYEMVKAQAMLLATNPSTWIFAMVMGLTELYQQLSAVREATNKLVNSLQETSREVNKTISEFNDKTLDITIRFKAGELNPEEVQALYKELKDKLTDITGNDKFVFSKLGGLNTDEGIDYMLGVLDDIDKANARLLVTANHYNANKNAFWGLFGEGLDEDMQDLEESFKFYEKMLELDNKNRLEWEIARKNALNSNSPDYTFGLPYNDSRVKSASNDLQISYNEAYNEIKKITDQIKKDTKDLSDESVKYYTNKILEKQMEALGGFSEYAKQMFKTIAYSQLGFVDPMFEQIITNAKSSVGVTASFLKQTLEEAIGNAAKTGSPQISDELMNAINKGLDGIPPIFKNEVDICRRMLKENPLTFLVNLQIANGGGTQQSLMQQWVMNKLPEDIAEWFKTSSFWQGIETGIDTSLFDALKAKRDADKKALETQYKNMGSLSFQGQEEKNRLELEIKRIEAVAKALDWNLDDNKEKGGGSQTDPWLEELKNRIKAVESLNSEYKRLNKTLGENKSQELVKKYEAYGRVLEQDKFGVFDLNAFIDKIIKENEKLLQSSKSRKAYLEQLYDKWNKDNSTDIIDGLEKINKKIQEQIDLCKTAVKVYEDVFNATGNAKMAETLASIIDPIVSSLKDINNIGVLDDALKGQTGKGVMEWFRMSYDEVEEAKKNMDSNIGKLIDTARDAVRNKQTSIASDIAKVVADAYTVEQKIEMQKSINDKKKADARVYLGVTENEDGTFGGDPEKIKIYKDYVEGLDKAFNELAETLRSNVNPEFEQLFMNMADDNIKYMLYQLKQVKDVMATFKKNSDGTYTSTTEKYGTITLTEKQYNSYIKKQVKLTHDMESQIRKIDPFHGIAISLKNLKEATTKEDKDKSLVNLINDITASANVAADATAKIFESFGDSKTANDIKNIGGLLDNVGAIIASYYSGNYAGMVAGAAGLVESIVNIFDSGLNNAINRIEKRLSNISGLRKTLQTKIEHELGYGMATIRNALNKSESDFMTWWYSVNGMDYLIDQSKQSFNERFGIDQMFNNWELDILTNTKNLQNLISNEGAKIAGAYMEQYQLLIKELTNKQAELQAQQDKSNKDEDAINQLSSDIQDLSVEIRYFAQDLLSEIYGIDLKDWASQISDSLVNAFRNGEDAALAFKNTVNDLMASVVNRMLKMYIIEPALKDLEQYLFGDDGRGGVFGADGDTPFELTADELAGMGQHLAKVNDSIGHSKELFDYINEGLKDAGIDLTANGEANGLSKGIQSITEDASNLLASYINAIRADVAVIRAIDEANSGGSSLSAVAQQQLSELTAISRNVEMNRKSVERIETLFNSVVTSGSNGKRIRI